MATFLLSFGIIGLSALGLALGSLFGRDAVKGSCGGLACSKIGRCAGCKRGSAEDAS